MTKEETGAVVAPALLRAESMLLQARMERIVAEEQERAAERVVARVKKLLPKREGKPRG